MGRSRSRSRDEEGDIDIIAVAVEVGTVIVIEAMRGDRGVTYGTGGVYGFGGEGWNGKLTEVFGISGFGFFQSRRKKNVPKIKIV
ncbi:hypothetical protein FOZ60_003979 [Perkinsus olseni]|uniref:Uncharacterized protein n=1 Tax=Perkinsus olseni TaxID=32597 RepID=A0A7J6NUJ0_PEROL|nr:hypothetical protein FOZ60_003979 [Perkinsus olseni]